MSRIYELYLQDILKSIEKIKHFTSGIDVDVLVADELRYDGVLFNLVTIGEAVKSIPDDIRATIPEVRWRDIGRFRDRVIHHYYDVDIEIIWEIIQVHLPILEEHVKQLLLAQSRSDPDES